MALLLLAPTLASPAPVARRLQLAPIGAGSGDQLGINVAGQGDLNGDGYDDFVVSGFLNDAGGPDAGRVYLYFGGPAMDAAADLIFTGEAAGDNLGQLGDAGDVNGDGYPDVLLGANMNDAGATNAGRAYLYYGGPGMDTTPDVIFTGAGSNYLFASRVSCSPDVNDDGYADVVIGEIANPAKGTRTGRAYLYFGGPAMDNVADVIFTGEAASDEFGLVASAGDLNADGYDDVIIGAWLNSALGINSGRAYLYLGGPAMDNVADLTFTGEAAGDRMATSVRGTGDLNGDGYTDLAIGAYANNAGGTDAGRAYVYFGGPGLDNVADVTLTGDAADDAFGKSVCGAGDVNGDGYADLVVGAFTSDYAGYNSGRAYVFLGGSPMNSAPDFWINPEAPGDHLGYWVGNAGDVNGDGFTDVLAGASFSDAGGIDSGRAYLYDFNRYMLRQPNGGEVWPAGGFASVSWLGAEPADLWLSTDGGVSFQLLEASAGGSDSNAVSVAVPHEPTSDAMIRVTPSNPSVAGSDQSDATFTISEATAVAPGTASGPSFSPPRPNPATESVQLTLELPRAGRASVSVFDLAGRLVATPVANELLSPGRTTRAWRPQALAPGTYQLRARIAGHELARRLVWLGSD